MCFLGTLRYEMQLRRKHFLFARRGSFARVWCPSHRITSNGCELMFQNQPPGSPLYSHKQMDYIFRTRVEPPKRENLFASTRGRIDRGTTERQRKVFRQEQAYHLYACCSCKPCIFDNISYLNIHAFSVADWPTGLPARDRWAPSKSCKRAPFLLKKGPFCRNTFESFRVSK